MEEQLTKINKLLNIEAEISKNKKLVFIYSAPKVGSTSLVSSLRIYGINNLDIIHIHDEKMLDVLLNYKSNISINDLIKYNKMLGKDVYVINVYRSPIERKISAFFEKIGSYHFNNTDENVNKYNVKRVINRFNNIFPHIANGDHFTDVYNITLPQHFDYNAKYLLVQENGINYISLRLCDSNEWSSILTNIFGFHIKIIKDYETSNKPIKDLYTSFKNNYKVPINLLNELITDKYLKYYYSENEINAYYNQWLQKSTEEIKCYTHDEYKLYEKITIENSHLDTIQRQMEHYFDEGCVCKACQIKRRETIVKINSGIAVTERIIHSIAKSSLIQKRAKKASEFNNTIKTLQKTKRGKDFSLLTLN